MAPPTMLQHHVTTRIYEDMFWLDYIYTQWLIKEIFRRLYLILGSTKCKKMHITSACVRVAGRMRSYSWLYYLICMCVMFVRRQGGCSLFCRTDH